MRYVFWQCNGHADVSAGICDASSGLCFCTGHTAGDRCQFCQDGFVGDPGDGKPCFASCSAATGGRKRILDGGATDNGLLGSDGGEGESGILPRFDLKIISLRAICTTFCQCRLLMPPPRKRRVLVDHHPRPQGARQSTGKSFTINESGRLDRGILSRREGFSSI